MTSLLDQSALTDLAERLVAAARRAGADAADAVAVRSMSLSVEVRPAEGATKWEGASASAGIGGMVLATSHGFRGSYLSSRQGVGMAAIAGDGTAMERDYDFSSALHGSDLDAADAIGRSAGERAVARVNPRKVPTKKVPV